MEFSSIMYNFFYIFILLAWRTCYSLEMEDKKVKFEKRNAIIFPDNLLPEKKEIPLSLIRRINELETSDVNEFLDNFVEPENSTFEIMSRIGPAGIERSALQTAKAAKCMPELKTVSLVPKSDTTVFYYPSCTRVERCGGCCGHRLLSCQPVESEIIQYKVAVAEYGGGNKLKFRNTEIIGVEQHKKCKCECKVQPEHCSKYQKYNEKVCACECQNTDDMIKCAEEWRIKLWNKDICSCTCKKELPCTNGFYFDPFTCRCEEMRGRRRLVRPKLWSFDLDKEY